MADLTKIAEELGKLTVLEAAELVKSLEEEWGVSAAAPAAAAAAPAAAAEAAEEKLNSTSCSLKPVVTRSLSLRQCAKLLADSVLLMPRNLSRVLPLPSSRQHPRMTQKQPRPSLKKLVPRLSSSSPYLRFSRLQFYANTDFLCVWCQAHPWPGTTHKSVIFNHQEATASFIKIIKKPRLLLTDPRITREDVPRLLPKLNTTKTPSVIMIARTGNSAGTSASGSCAKYCRIPVLRHCTRLKLY